MKTDPLGQSFMDFAETLGVKFVDCTPSNMMEVASFAEKMKRNEGQHTCLNKEIGIEQAYQNAGSETCDRLMEIIRTLCSSNGSICADDVISELPPVERTKTAIRSVVGSLKRACKNKWCKVSICPCCDQPRTVESKREGNNRRRITVYETL